MVPLLSKEMLICTAMESMAPMDMAATTGSVDSTAPSLLDTTLDSETNTGSGRATPTDTSPSPPSTTRKGSKLGSTKSPTYFNFIRY